MVRSGEALGAVALGVVTSVTKFFPYDDGRHGLPALNVLYTTDDTQAASFLHARLNSSAVGVDMQWRYRSKRGELTRSSLLRIACGEWVLIYDLLPTPWFKKPPRPLSPKICSFLQDESRTLFGMSMMQDAARLSFELNCAITRGIDLRKSPWPGSALSHGGIFGLGNEILDLHLSQIGKVPDRSWEYRPLSWPQLHYMVEHSYVSWAVGDHFLKTAGPAREGCRLTENKVYAAGRRLRSRGMTARKTRHNWKKAAAAWERSKTRKPSSKKGEDPDEDEEEEEDSWQGGDDDSEIDSEATLESDDDWEALDEEDEASQSSGSLLQSEAEVADVSPSEAGSLGDDDMAFEDTEEDEDLLWKHAEEEDAAGHWFDIDLEGEEDDDDEDEIDFGQLYFMLEEEGEDHDDAKDYIYEYEEEEEDDDDEFEDEWEEFELEDFYPRQ